MKPFVLIHGGLQGAWAWRDVRRALQAAGAEVFTPTLTGLGAREHLNTPDIDLETHVLDVVNCILAEELDDVVLVGHSYGGMPVTGAADRLLGRISRLVYLYAAVPEDGESISDMLGGDPAAASVADGIMPVPADLDFGLTDPDIRAWNRRRMRPQSWRTLNQKLRIRNDISRLRRTFIHCIGDEGHRFASVVARGAERARNDPGWDYHELVAGPLPHMTAPEQVAALLLRIAAEEGEGRHAEEPRA